MNLDGHPEDQQAFVDARAPLKHDGDELVDDPTEDRPADNPNDPETPRSLMEPEFEHGSTPPRTRPRSSEELMNDGPFALRRRVELTPGELRADQGASTTDLWRRSGTAEPGIELVERQQDRERDKADALIAFYTDRGVGKKYRSKQGGKRSKNNNFETSDQFTQAVLTESRKVEWTTWKQFNAVYPVWGPDKETKLQLWTSRNRPLASSLDLDSEDLLLWTYDTGAAKIGTETETNECSYKIASGKLIPDCGGLRPCRERLSMGME